jgi:hypothetical protein
VSGWVRVYPRLKSALTKERLLIGCILLLGCVVRVAHLAFLSINAPNKGGGLFLEFAQQIAAHGFAIPSNVPFYTDEGIPFAYPPLPFYVEAILIHGFSLPKFLVANLLPPLTAILTLLVFYRLTKELELKPWTRMIALLAYATMTAAFSEPISAGGLAEAFGSLSLACFAISLVRAYKRDTVASHVVVGLLWAFCVLASPGGAYASVPTFLIFAIVQLVKSKWRPSWRTVLLLIAAGLIAVVVSSPYWLTVIANHGVQVFVSNLGAQHSHLFGFREDLVGFQVTGDMFLWNALLFCGLVWGILQRRWVLPVWFAVLYTIPREGWWIASIPAAITAGIGGAEVLGPPLIGIARRYQRKTEMIVLVGGLVLLIVGSTSVVIAEKVDGWEISREVVAALEWVNANTPPQSKFIVLVNKDVIEWAPHITQRTVLNVKCGTEFAARERGKISRLNNLLDVCQDFDCVQASLSKSRAIPSSGVQSYSKDGLCLMISQDRLSELMSSSDTGEVGFELMWENDKVAIGLLHTHPVYGRDFDFAVDLGANVGIVEVRPIPSSLDQGEMLDLDLRWGSRAAPGRDLTARLSLVDEAGVTQQSLDVLPGIDWPAEAVAIGRYQLQIDPHLPPGRYALTVELIGVGQSAVLAHLDVDPLPRTFEPPAQMMYALDARFGDEFRLLGYDLARDGDTLKLTLHWQAVQPTGTYYIVFVHLFDPTTGEIVVQDDAAPRRWAYPTAWWEAEEVVSDEIPLSMGDVAGGRYGLAVGMYHPDRGERLPVSDATGEEQPEGRLVLPEEIVW